MAREDPQMKLRLTETMRDRLKGEAERNRRSMNAEIVDRLESSFDSEMRDSDLLRSIRDMVMARKIEQMFGPDISESISFYSAYHTDAETWQAALEELIKKGLAVEGLGDYDDDELPTGGQHYRFWRRPEARAFMEQTLEREFDSDEAREGRRALDELANGPASGSPEPPPTAGRAQRKK